MGVGEGNAVGVVDTVVGIYADITSWRYSTTQRHFALSAPRMIPHARAIPGRRDVVTD